MTRPHACIVSAVRPARDVRTFHREARSLVRAGWSVTVIGRDAGPPAILDDIQILPLPAADGAGRALQQLRALRLALATLKDVVGHWGGIIAAAGRPGMRQYFGPALRAHSGEIALAPPMIVHPSPCSGVLAHGKAAWSTGRRLGHTEGGDKAIARLTPRQGRE